MATIKDIAKKLNISVSTVSYVMNDGPRKVPDEVKTKVLATARDLGYRPNRVARMLVTQRANTIGIVPDGPQLDTMVGPYLRNVFNVVLNVAELRSQDVLFMTTHSERDPDIYANSVLDGRVDGVLLIGADRRKDLIDIIVERNFPHVLINTHCSPASPVFTIDNKGGVRLLLQHLYDLGHRKFGLITGIPDHGDSKLREDAFYEFVQSTDAQTRPEWQAVGRFHLEGGYEAAQKILAHKQKPTALVALNDESALGALRAARDLGLHVPTDLSITGFDDTEWVRNSEAITTVAQNEPIIAAAATEALLRIIEGDKVEGQIFTPELKVRESTDCPKEDIPS